MVARMSLGTHEVIRSHALGNDYLVIEGATFGVELTEARIRRICNRHTGVGSDGILERTAPPAGFDAALRIWNPDGSEAEKSGNGVRIFAKYLFDHTPLRDQPSIRIHTLGGPVSAVLLGHDGQQSTLRVSMGKVSFVAADLPMNAPGEFVAQPIQVGDRVYTATCLSVGNPHCVLMDAPLDEETLGIVGPLVERHALFPRRTNMQIMQVVDRQTVRALIWERGAGRTESSGSSACAVAATAVRAGLTDRAVKVVMPGGTLEVSIDEAWNLEQVGQAQEILCAPLSPEFAASL